MVRLLVVASSISLLGMVPPVQAGWADWRVYQPGPLWVFETGNAPSGPQLSERCFIIANNCYTASDSAGPPMGEFESQRSV